MDQGLKQRLVGAVVIVAAAIIVLPLVLRGPPAAEGRDPAGAGGGQDFRSSVVPLEESSARTAEREQVARAAPPSAAAEGRSRAGDARPRGPGGAGAAGSAGGGSEPRVGLSGWAIQIGSFSNGKNAVALRQRLEESGYTAFTESAYGSKGPVTRVYVGPELERADAERLAEKLRRASKLNGLVVRYPSG